MSQPIKCSLCEEAATVHLSQVVHGKVTKVYLCEACAQKGGATDPAVFQLADAAHYPAIDLNGSISRIMSNLLEPDALKLANRFRRLWSLYQQNRDLIQVGAYVAGTNPELDEAIRLRPAMEAFLRQDMHLAEDEATTRQRLREMMNS